MLGVIIGEVKAIDKVAHIFDVDTKEVHEVEMGEGLLDIKVGDTGIFWGDMIHGRLRMKRIDVRKFLDPLYEEDLFAASGMHTLVQTINDPFSEAYIEFMEKRNELSGTN